MRTKRGVVQVVAVLPASGFALVPVGGELSDRLALLRECPPKNALPSMYMSRQSSAFGHWLQHPSGRSECAPVISVLSFMQSVGFSFAIKP
jgi:hypothetical protein